MRKSFQNHLNYEILYFKYIFVSLLDIVPTVVDTIIFGLLFYFDEIW